MKLPKTNWSVPRPSQQFVLLLIQLAGLLAVLVGIAMWCIPAAFIVGGLAVIAAIELQQDTPDLSSDRTIKDMIDKAVTSGQNPFSDERVPMTGKWLAYSQLVTRKL